MTQEKEQRPPRGITRRDFLVAAGSTAVGAVGYTAFRSIIPSEPPWQGQSEWDYQEWEDLYRKEWVWDRVQYACHSVGCVGKCSFKVYSKGGIPLREEQTATYPIYAKHTPGKYTFKIMGEDRGEYVRYGPFGRKSRDSVTGSPSAWRRSQSSATWDVSSFTHSRVPQSW